MLNGERESASRRRRPRFQPLPEAGAAAARLMDSVTRTALTLDRLRHGSRQQVVVQHVSVRDGGQAVVAGSVAPGGGIGARSRGGLAK